MAARPARKKKKTKRRPLSPTEKAFRKLQRDHRSAIRSIFNAVGFRRVTGVADKEFTFDNQPTDLDDIFVFENVVIAAEYTCAQESGVGDHLKKKKIPFDKMLENPRSFLEFLVERFPDSADQLKTNYHNSKLILRIIYCSRHDFDSHYKITVPGPIYMDYPAVRYFAALSNSIKMSARFELLHFLGISTSAVGSRGMIQVSVPSRDYSGSILPEAHSNFDDGYKVVTFYADPDALLRTAYVLRKDGWRLTHSIFTKG